MITVGKKIQATTKSNETAGFYLVMTLTQTCTCSNSTIETLKIGKKYIQS